MLRRSVFLPDNSSLYGKFYCKYENICLFRRPAASQAGISGSVAGSAVSGSRRRVPADPRVRAQQSSNNLQTQLNLQAGTDRRTRIPPRTRVRNPNLPGKIGTNINASKRLE